MNTLFSINNLSLFNYKCYDDSRHEIAFGKNLTVIIGQNGSGKTALLNAIKKSVSIILSKDKRKNVVFVGDGYNIKQNTLKVGDARYNFNFNEVGEDYEFPVRLECQGTVRTQFCEWFVEKESKASHNGVTYRKALDMFLAPFNDGISVYPSLPVLCFFSDCFPHVRNDMTTYEKDILYNKSDNRERRAGYYRWDEDSTDFYFWMGMFINAYKELNDTVNGFYPVREKLQTPGISDKSRAILEDRMATLLRFQKELDYISSWIKRFSCVLCEYSNENIEIESIGVGHYVNDKGKAKDSLKIHFASGDIRYFDMLPEGHKRIFSIVFEIAYRHFVLNRNLVLKDAQSEPEGIVIIDEVELHLHPSLAEEIVVRLTQTFPRVQFIITTHSPSVVSNFYNDGVLRKIYRLDSNHGFVEIKNVMGYDYADTLVFAMNSYSSMRYLQTLRQQYLVALQMQDNAKVNDIRKALCAYIGEVENRDAIVADIENEWKELF